MALIVKDRVRETSISTGTGNITLLGAVARYFTFVSEIGNGNTTYYCIENRAANQVEMGVGTMTGGALVRTDAGVIKGTAGAGTRVNFSVGTKDVYCVAPAQILRPLWIYKAADYAMVSGDQIDFDTSAAVRTATMPAAPTDGDRFFFNDAKGTFSTNSLLIDLNGKTMSDGVTTTLDCNIPAQFCLVYMNNQYHLR